MDQPRALIFIKSDGPGSHHWIGIAGEHCGRNGYHVATVVTADWHLAYRLVYDPEQRIADVLVVPDRGHLPDGVVPPPRTEIVSEEPAEQPEALRPPRQRPRPQRVRRLREEG